MMGNQRVTWIVVGVVVEWWSECMEVGCVEWCGGVMVGGDVETQKVQR
jgi:hypothetical protein